jgi:hypothetical protein
MALTNPDMLQAIGRIAVHAAIFENQLHAVHWAYSGLKVPAGQIITGEMKPKRVFEDIIKLVKANCVDPGVFAI